nr:CocE/NonD family hydrolase [Sulfobacillus harzensis]
MRDGVRLATDVYRSGNQTGKVPAILLRTPYDKGAAERSAMAMRWADAGYACVVQDCRGRFLSDGVFKLGQNEAEDGFDTVEWIAAQPWCTGKVGTIGTSYMAWVQSALATLNPPHLACMWVHEGIANPYKESLRQGGAFELRWMGWALYGAQTDPHLTDEQRQTLQTVDLRDWLRPRLPLAGESPLAMAPNMEEWYLEYLTQGVEGGPLDYRGINIEGHYAEHADVPSVYSGGWYDSYTRATIRNWAALSQTKHSPPHLVMGPWTHGSNEPGLTYAGNVDFGSDAAIDYFELRRQWFDYWLKGKGDDPLPRVRYFLMGGGIGSVNEAGRLDHGGAWRAAEMWPPSEAAPQTLYGQLDGSLREKAEERVGVLGFISDPDHPVPTIGGNISFLKYLRPRAREFEALVPVLDRLEFVSPIGGQDQTTYPGLFGAEPPYGPLNLRRDVVSFVSEPLREDLTIVGPISVDITVSADTRDFDITAKLVDWYPPTSQWPAGFALNITDGILRMRFRDGFDREAVYSPGTPTTITVECYPTANRFVRGHRVRLDIAGSNFPRFDVNPNTGSRLGDMQRSVIAHPVIHLGPDTPVRLNVMVIP